MTSCDIFCRVVDNFGDIAICWRLAGQLAREHGYRVRLWVDDLTVFHALCAEVEPARAVQPVQGVQVIAWTAEHLAVEPAALVIEAFACELPDGYVEAMVERAPHPVWINLEYLSAEDWVAGCHGLASPHPRLPLVKHFFFPGFGPGTGGLIREQGLLDAREAFDDEQAARLLQRHGLCPDRMSVSVFGYENAALPAWLQAMRQGLGGRCQLLLPRSRSRDCLEQSLGCALPEHGVLELGPSRLCGLPFMASADYDRLLWACDLNIVRGEDSVVRAQWAQRPLIWHIYPQQDEAHWVKLDAWLDRYCADLDPDAAAWLRQAHRLWNAPQTDMYGWSACWSGLSAHLPALQAHALRWARQLAALGDLASNLVRFHQNCL